MSRTFPDKFPNNTAKNVVLGPIENPIWFYEWNLHPKNIHKKLLNKKLDPGIPSVGFYYFPFLAVNFDIFRPQIRTTREKLWI